MGAIVIVDRPGIKALAVIGDGDEVALGTELR